MSYNLTIIGQSNSTVEFIQNVNNVLLTTGNNPIGWLGIIILVLVFMILFISFVASTRQPIKSMTGAAFITTIISFLVVGMGLAPEMAVWIPAIGTALGIALWKLD